MFMPTISILMINTLKLFYVIFENTITIINPASFSFQDESHLPHISITWNRNPNAMEYDYYCQRGKIELFFNIFLCKIAIQFLHI